MPTFSTTIASPTELAIWAAKRAWADQRARLGSVIRRAHLPDLPEQVVQVERLRDDVVDLPLRELVPVLRCGGADEEHGHVLDLGVLAHLVIDLEPVQSGHHDVEDEEVGVHLAYGVDEQRAVRDHHRLVATLVIHRVPKQDRDRLVVLADDNDALARLATHALTVSKERG